MKLLIAFIAGSILSALLVVGVGMLGLLPSKATSEPPRWEVLIGGAALEASLEHRSKGLKNPVAANDKSALVAGKKTYADMCAGCHGDAKGPSSWGAHDFYPRVPQFYQLKENDLTPEEAYAAVHDGIRYSGMAAWADQLSDQRIWQVANFVAGISHTPSPQQSAGKRVRG